MTDHIITAIPWALAFAFGCAAIGFWYRAGQAEIDLRYWRNMYGMKRRYAEAMEALVEDGIKSVGAIQENLNVSRELASSLMRERGELREKLSAVDARAAELADDEKATQRVVRERRKENG